MTAIPLPAAHRDLAHARMLLRSPAPITAPETEWAFDVLTRNGHGNFVLMHKWALDLIEYAATDAAYDRYLRGRALRRLYLAAGVAVMMMVWGMW